MKIQTYGPVSGLFEPQLSKWLLKAEATIPLKVCSAGPSLQAMLDAWDGQADLLRLVACQFGDTTATRLLISASDNHSFKAWCENLLGHARWGCCLSETIAIEYAPRGYALSTQLHEGLHLFGVDECYNEANPSQAKPACDNERCLMRYGSSHLEVCSSVLEQLRMHASRP